MPVKTAAPAPRKKRRLRRLLLLATISGLLAIALAEIGLRMISAALYPAIYELDERIGWRHTPSVVRMLRDEDGREVLFSTDVHGMRIHPRKVADQHAERTLLFLGDSFTQASQVHADESFVALVDEQLPSTRCLNAGVGGYSTVQQWLVLDNLLQQWAPDVVVLVIYENDFIDNLMPFFSGLGPRPYARVEDKRIEIEREQDVASFEPYLQPAPAAFWLYQHCAIYRSVHKTIFLPTHGEKLSTRETQERARVPLAAQRLAMADLLREMLTACTARNKELRIAALPSRRMAKTGKAPSHDFLAATCKRLGIDFLSLQPALHGRHQTAYFAHDIHFTAAGHKLVTNLLVPFLED